MAQSLTGICWQAYVASLLNWASILISDIPSLFVNTCMEKQNENQRKPYTIPESGRTLKLLLPWKAMKSAYWQLSYQTTCQDQHPTSPPTIKLAVRLRNHWPTSSAKCTGRGPTNGRTKSCRQRCSGGMCIGINFRGSQPADFSTLAWWRSTDLQPSRSLHCQYTSNLECVFPSSQHTRTAKKTL